MDRFSPFFSRKWLDGTHQQYVQQRDRLISFLDSYPRRRSEGFLRVILTHYLSQDILSISKPFFFLFNIPIPPLVLCWTDPYYIFHFSDPSHYSPIATSADRAVGDVALLVCWSRSTELLTWNCLVGNGNPDRTAHRPDLPDSRSRCKFALTSLRLSAALTELSLRIVRILFFQENYHNRNNFLIIPVFYPFFSYIVMYWPIYVIVTESVPVS